MEVCLSGLYYFNNFQLNKFHWVTFRLPLLQLAQTELTPVDSQQPVLRTNLANYTILSQGVF